MTSELKIRNANVTIAGQTAPGDGIPDEWEHSESKLPTMLRIHILTYCTLLCWCMNIKAQPQCTVTHYDEFSGMAQWYVTQIVQDRQGMMWFATWNGLNRYDGYEFQCFKSRPGDGVDIPSDRIQDMMLADDGNLLCLIEGRVFLFNTESCLYSELPKEKEQALIQHFANKYPHKTANANTPYNIYKDKYGTEWMICSDGSLFTRSGQTDAWQPYQTNIPMRQNVQFCIADREGNAWLRSSYGAYRLVFKHPAYQWFPQQIPSQIRYFCVDSHQRYWITSKEDATVRLYSSDNRLLGYLGRDGRLHSQYVSFGSPVYCMMEDSKGVFWLGSKPDGLFRLTELSNGTFTVEHFQHNSDIASLGYDHVFYLKEDSRGRIWVGTFEGGLNCLEHPHDKELHFLHKDNGLGLPKDDCLHIRQIHITKEGILLAATTTGLLVANVDVADLHTVKWKKHKKDARRHSSLSNNATMFVAEDGSGRIHICTESGGVNQIVSEDLLGDELEFRHFDTSTGMPSDVALSAFEENGCLYVISNNQIICLTPDALANSQNAKYDSYLWNDHLRFSDATSLLLPDGRRIFGLQDGALVIKPKDILNSKFTPPIALTGISVQNQAVNYAVNALDTLVLSPPERNLTVSFAALDYSDSGDIHYAFRLKGGSGQWNNIGTDHSATFLDLRPGSYILEIRSTNRDGVWVDNVRGLTIIVKPTFWETRWARLLYVCILLLIVWALLYTHRYIIGLKRRQKELHEAYLDLLNTSAPSTTTAPAVEPSPTKPEMKPEDEAFMKRAMTFIEEHLGDADINIGDMADATATSRSGLNRKMKSLLGVTPLDFIREARIRKACQLLKQGLAVNDVAYSCGFSDPKYFAKCFKAEIGMTPKEYKVENSVN